MFLRFAGNRMLVPRCDRVVNELSSICKIFVEESGRRGVCGDAGWDENGLQGEWVNELWPGSALG